MEDRIDDEFIWDPVYGSLEEYAKDYDFDLLGRKISKQSQFFEDPVNKVGDFIRNLRFEIIAVCVGTMLILIFMILLKHACVKCFFKIVKFLKFFIQLLILKWKSKKEIGLETANYDKLASDVYNLLGKYKNVYNMDNDMVEFESTRFAWEAVYPTGLCFQQLEELAKSSNVVLSENDSIDEIPIENKEVEHQSI